MNSFSFLFALLFALIASVAAQTATTRTVVPTKTEVSLDATTIDFDLATETETGYNDDDEEMPEVPVDSSSAQSIGKSSPLCAAAFLFALAHRA